MIAVRSRYFNEVMFLLLVILQHGMRRLALMVNGVNSFTASGVEVEIKV